MIYYTSDLIRLQLYLDLLCYYLYEFRNRRMGKALHERRKARTLLQQYRYTILNDKDILSVVEILAMLSINLVNDPYVTRDQGGRYLYAILRKTTRIFCVQLSSLYP